MAQRRRSSGNGDGARRATRNGSCSTSTTSPFAGGGSSAAASTYPDGPQYICTCSIAARILELSTPSSASIALSFRSARRSRSRVWRSSSPMSSIGSPAGGTSAGTEKSVVFRRGRQPIAERRRSSERTSSCSTCRWGRPATSEALGVTCCRTTPARPLRSARSPRRRAPSSTARVRPRVVPREATSGAARTDRRRRRGRPRSAARGSGTWRESLHAVAGQTVSLVRGIRVLGM
jgi:hypothetical protein